MKVFVKNGRELSQYVNGLLNAPSVADLVMEAEALVYEIECRMLKTAEDHKTLAAAREKALTVVREQKCRSTPPKRGHCRRDQQVLSE
jgi:hypothetical protein